MTVHLVLSDLHTYIRSTSSSDHQDWPAILGGEIGFPWNYRCSLIQCLAFSVILEKNVCLVSLSQLWKTMWWRRERWASCCNSFLIPWLLIPPQKRGYSHLFPGRPLNFPQDWDCSSVCKLINCPIYWSLFSAFFLSMLSQKFVSQMLNLKNFKWSDRCGFHPTGWWHQEEETWRIIDLSMFLFS